MEIASIEMWQARIYNELMIPLAMGFRHLHPAMSSLEKQNKDYGETQKSIGIKSLKYFNGVLSESEFVAGERSVASLPPRPCRLLGDATN